MRNHLLPVALGLGLLGCASYQSSQATSSNGRKEIAIPDFVRSLPKTEQVVIAYDAYKTAPGPRTPTPSGPSAPALPNASLSQLEQELKDTSDSAREQSLKDTLVFMKACYQFGIPCFVTRVQRDLPLSSSLRYKGLLPTTFVYAFKQPDIDEVRKIEQMYWNNKNIKSYKIHRDRVITLD